MCGDEGGGRGCGEDGKEFTDVSEGDLLEGEEG